MRPFYLTRKLAANYVREHYGLRCSEKWLAKLVVTGGGPPFWKDGRAVLYSPYALDAWAASRIKGPWVSTSDVKMNEARRRLFSSSHRLPFEDAQLAGRAATRKN